MSTRLRLLRSGIGSLLLTAGVAPAAHAASASITYGYDALGRIGAAYYDNGTCIAFSYDAVGNRTAQSNTTAGAPGTSTWGGGSWGCFQWAELNGAKLAPYMSTSRLAMAEGSSRTASSSSPTKPSADLMAALPAEKRW
ncbi:hypothetical protein [Phenylobacterium sp.]|uniref:hypothetical protein n=1 Tax=Phenylobacterium sp. TaxID=1871053 RepID=UPI002FCA80DC